MGPLWSRPGLTATAVSTPRAEGRAMRRDGPDPRPHPDAAIAHLANDQHGVFSHDQARRLGCTKRMIEHRVAVGRWDRLAQGVYLLGGADRGFLTAAHAATLLTPHSVVSGLAAAGLHRLTGFGAAPVEVSVPPPASTASPLATVRRRIEFDATRAHGIPVTTIAQTVADLCGTRLPLERIERATDDAILDRRLLVGHLEDQAVRHTRLRSRGVRRLRSLVAERADGQPVAESVLEPLLWRLVRHPDVPPAVRQHRLPWTIDGRTARVDLFIEAWGLILEADGRRWHTRIADFERDRQRDRAAMAHGLIVVRFTWLDLTTAFATSQSDLLQIGRRRALELGHA